MEGRERVGEGEGAAVLDIEIRGGGDERLTPPLFPKVDEGHRRQQPGLLRPRDCPAATCGQITLRPAKAKKWGIVKLILVFIGSA